MSKTQSLNLSDIFGTTISREEALSRIYQDSTTGSIFDSMKEHDREAIIAFIQGQHGLKICYDPFFQKIFSVDEHPERLESLLSALMKEPVTIQSVLPRDGLRLSEEGSITIMDIIVERSDGSLVDCEMQKIGYYFPGERSCCYESDMIMRQYNRIKNKLKDDFTYQKMKPVFLIILMEKSSREFQEAAPAYIHHKTQGIDTGVKVTFLANTMYISLDTFHKVVQNITNDSSNERNYQNAWLMFLSSDEPADIINLCTAFPEFREYYQDIVEFRKNPKELIYMYSKSLAETDMNTQRYMFRDMQNQIEEMREKAVALQEQMRNMRNEKATLQDENAALIAYIQSQGLELPPQFASNK